MHHSVDDAPYGGGPGMVMKAPVWGDALDEICSGETLLVVPTPAGRAVHPGRPRSAGAPRRTWCSPAAATRASTSGSSTMPPRRMRVEEVSIGDYVLPGGESAAVVMIEAVLRLLPEYWAIRSRTKMIRILTVCSGGAELHPAAELARTRRPGCLLSGDHARVASWRRESPPQRTRERRPTAASSARGSDPAVGKHRLHRLGDRRRARWRHQRAAATRSP